MECFFINNIDVPYNDRKRKAELYDRFIDEYFLPADMVCIAGGISEFLDIEITFLIRLAQRYPNVYYVYGGSDLKSDIPLDFKFERISKKFDGNVSDAYYDIMPYIHNMDTVMSAADLVICRSGAITLSEVCALGKPSILIPSPNLMASAIMSSLPIVFFISL